MGDLSNLIKRKVELVIEIVDETPHDAPARAGAYAATRLMLDDVDAALGNPEFPYEASGGNVDINYLQNQARSLRSYVDYYFGLGRFTDVGPGDARNVHSFAYKLMGLLPTA